MNQRLHLVHLLLVLREVAAGSETIVAIAEKVALGGATDPLRIVRCAQGSSTTARPAQCATVNPPLLRPSRLRPPLVVAASGAQIAVIVVTMAMGGVTSLLRIARFAQGLLMLALRHRIAGKLMEPCCGGTIWCADLWNVSS